MTWQFPAADFNYLWNNDPLQNQTIEEGEGGTSTWCNLLAQLIGAKASAFGEVERELSSTAQLAQVTAQGLRDLDTERDQWTGQAADTFRAKLGHLPLQLDQVHDNFTQALAEVARFSAHTFQLQAKADSWYRELLAWRLKWNDVQGFPTKAEGELKIKSWKDELSQLTSEIHWIIGTEQTLTANFLTDIEGLMGNIPAPHESEWRKLFAPVIDFVDQVAGTWDAFKNFVRHRTWSNFAALTASIAADATIVALAVSAPEALTGLGVLDLGADSTILSVAKVVGGVAKVYDTAATAGGITAEAFEHEYGAAALDAILAIAPHAFDFDEPTLKQDPALEHEVGAADLLATYAEDLAKDGSGAFTNDLTPAQQQAVKQLIGAGYENPTRVQAVVGQVGTELATQLQTEGGGDPPAGYTWKDGVLVPVHG